LPIAGNILPPVQAARIWHGYGGGLAPSKCGVAHALRVGTRFALRIPGENFVARGGTRMFDKLFGVHEQALLLRGERVGVLAANLANVDTPNYKARDLDFDAVLSGIGEKSLALTGTQRGHLSSTATNESGGELKYRWPYQTALDGNTVEMPVEQAAFAENSVRYQASLMFINREIAGLQLAITGQ
jgi:flagellar basal-body rod protein FlgB